MGCSWGLFLVVVLPTFHLGVCHTGFNLPPGKNGLGVVLGGEAGGGGVLVVVLPTLHLGIHLTGLDLPLDGMEGQGIII